MHYQNFTWLNQLRALFWDIAHGDILELGSNYANESGNGDLYPGFSAGVVRGIFQGWAKRYVGVDIAPGPGVDIVSDAASLPADLGQFDIVLNISLMEHAPNWRDIVRNTMKFVKPNGAYIVTCGCEMNARHPPEPWAEVPSGELVRVLTEDPDFLLIYAAFEEYADPLTVTPGVFDVVLRRKAPQSESGV